MRHAALDVTETLFPEKITLAGNELPLRYRFAPGQPNDGLTLTVPLALLNQIDVGRLSWLVPGMIREKVTLLLKALPKQLRNRLHPLPDAVTAFLESVPYGEGPLTDALARWLRGRLRESIAPDLWDDVNVPPHLQMEVRVIDASGRELATGRDVAALRAELGEAAQLSFAGAKPALERRGLKSWDFGTLPETLATIRNGQRITGYPALVDDGDSVSIALVDTQEAAQAAMRAGVIRLIRIAVERPLGLLRPCMAPGQWLLRARARRQSGAYVTTPWHYPRLRLRRRHAADDQKGRWHTSPRAGGALSPPG